MPRAPHLLLVEDDREIRTLLARFLTDQGFRVSQAGDGRQMGQVMNAGRIDLVVLDLMLPGEDGFALCRKLRQMGDVPIIILTARGDETDRIVGLELGADDYVTKPFNPRELAARVRAILRRATGVGRAEGDRATAARLFDGWRLDVDRRTLTDPCGALVVLSTGEFDLLVALVEHAGRVLSRDQLLDLARGRSSVLFDRSIDVQVSRLRRKIEADPQNPTLIKTVRNGGYVLSARVEAVGFGG